MPSLSRKERKRKEAHAKKTAQEDLSGDVELLPIDLAKPVMEDDMSVAELNDKADTKDDDTLDVVHAEHQLEGVPSEVGEKDLVENNDPSEDVEAAAISQGSLEDIFTSTPPVNSEDDALEITPNPPSKKKVKRTKKHTHDCPQNPSRKLLFGGSKKEGKKTSKKSHRTKRKCDYRKEFQDRDIHQQGVWVQCDNFRCRKWRFLSSITDPAKVEKNWTCAMHPDDTFNSCDKPEEDYHHLEFIHNQFTEGSIVWAKMQGYPWWPAMVETDPDTGCFMEHEGIETEVTHYHCVFLDETVSRSWVPAIFVKTFEADGNPPGSLKLKKKYYSKQVMTAKERALDALNLPLKERIEKYGFGKTFKGVWKKKKSRENSFHYPDSAHLEEASEIDADDVLGDMLSSEDMEELMNETEGLMADAEEAVQEMSDDENILGKATGEEKRKIKHSRKRKPSKWDGESKVKRKKLKKKKSKKEKSRKVRRGEKKKRKMPLIESALKDEVKSDDGENFQDGKNLSCKVQVKENQDALNMEKKMGSDNEFDEFNEVMQKEEVQDSADVDQKQMKGGKEYDTCDEAAVKGAEESDKDEENKVDECVDTNEMEGEAEGMPVLSRENIDVDRNGNKVDGESEVGGKGTHDVDKGAKDEKVKGKKDHKTTKAEREEKRKEREVKRQLDLEEKEIKIKEKEMKKLKKEKEKQEKEEKRKEREIKKQQALEEKERKKKARIEKAEKKAKKINKLPKSSEDKHQDDSEKTPVKATGDAIAGTDAKAKKPKFSVPKGKSKAFVPPGGKPKTAIPTEQRAKGFTHPSQASILGDIGRNEMKGEGDGATPLSESSVPKDEESNNAVGNSGKEEPCLITNEKMGDSGIPPKSKKKKFSVKRKEISPNSAAKVECGKSSMETTPNSIPITTANDSESQGAKVSGKLDFKKEILLMSNKDITENPPNDSHVPVKCRVLENKDSNACSEVVRDTKDMNKNCKVAGGDSPRKTKQGQDVNACDNEDVLDLEWSEAPEMAGKKTLLTSVNDEDSDPFEAVEE